MTEQPATALSTERDEGTGVWYDIGSRPDRIAYLERFWPGLIADIRREAVADLRASLAAEAGTVLSAFDYEGKRHSPYCNRVMFSGSTGPDPVPPDPCSCDGPAIWALIDDPARAAVTSEATE